MRYRITVHKSEEGYSVSVPGLRGWYQGASDEEAVKTSKTPYTTMVVEDA